MRFRAVMVWPATPCFVPLHETNLRIASSWACRSYQYRANRRGQAFASSEQEGNCMLSASGVVRNRNRWQLVIEATKAKASIAVTADDSLGGAHLTGA